MANSDSGWYTVRCVFRSQSGKRWGPPDLADGESAYEERVTLWRTESADAAIEGAEEEAHRYESETDSEYLGIAQSYRMADAPEDGAEVFALVRRSLLEPDPYLDAFFDTGSEYEQQD